MVSPESLLHQQKPNLPGLDQPAQHTNPFQGIRRAGQAKRAQNFEKWQGIKNGDTAFQGMKNQSFGGLAGTQNGSMRQNKFS